MNGVMSMGDVTDVFGHEQDCQASFCSSAEFWARIPCREDDIDMVTYSPT